MNLRDIAQLRLIRQQIAGTKFKTAKEIVSWMGAMQAQDYAMAKWAVGIRLPGSMDKTIEAVVSKGDIIRTHVLRPTWHFLAAEDLRWMLELTAPRIKSIIKNYNTLAGFSEKTFSKVNSILEKELSDGRHLTRDELMVPLKKAKIDMSAENSSSHFMLRAELDGIVCSGEVRDGKQTYVLLEHRLPKTKPLTKDEALAKLAQRYFTSHCPATVQDFAWWSGLTAGDARHAYELVKTSFFTEKIGEQTFIFPSDFSLPERYADSVYLLPAFDEFTISYKDRSASIHADHNRKSITINGIFKPTIAINGQITGLWKRTTKKDHVLIETEFFKPHSKGVIAKIKKAAEGFGKFLGKNIEMKI